MWEFKRFGSSYLIYHCTTGKVLIRDKNGNFRLTIFPKGLEGTTYHYDTAPAECPDCHESVPEYIIIQMQLLQS